MDGSARHDVAGLLKQRFRWMFGTLQAAWKQRDTLFRPRFGGLGLVALPNLLLFQVLFPLVSPVMDLEMLLSLAAAASAAAPASRRVLGRHRLADARSSTRSSSRSIWPAAVLGFCSERREDWHLLIWLPLQRFWYRQLMYYVAVKSTMTAHPRDPRSAGASSNARRLSRNSLRLPGCGSFRERAAHRRFRPESLLEERLPPREERRHLAVPRRQRCNASHAGGGLVVAAGGRRNREPGGQRDQLRVGGVRLLYGGQQRVECVRGPFASRERERMPAHERRLPGPAFRRFGEQRDRLGRVSEPEQPVGRQAEDERRRRRSVTSAVCHAPTASRLRPPAA